MKLVYHYTNIEAAKSILLGKGGLGTPKPCLWMTHYRFVNDTSELSAVLNLVNSEATDTESEELRAARAFFEDILAQVSPYIVSFCSSPDKLSQWRAYARGPTGVALGFDPLRVSEYDKPMPCIYEKHNAKDPGEFQKAVVERFGKLLQSARSGLSVMENPEMVQAVFGVHSLETDSLLRKPIAFQEEEEWRSTHWAPEPDGFRATKYGLAPYVELELPANALREVWLGPAADQHSAVLGMELFLKRAGFPGVTVHQSKATFRD